MTILLQPSLGLQTFYLIPKHWENVYLWTRFSKHLKFKKIKTSMVSLSAILIIKYLNVLCLCDYTYKRHCHHFANNRLWLDYYVVPTIICSYRIIFQKNWFFLFFINNQLIQLLISGFLVIFHLVIILDNGILI